MFLSDIVWKGPGWIFLFRKYPTKIPYSRPKLKVIPALLAEVPYSEVKSTFGISMVIPNGSYHKCKIAWIGGEGNHMRSGVMEGNATEELQWSDFKEASNSKAGSYPRNCRKVRWPTLTWFNNLRQKYQPQNIRRRNNEEILSVQSQSWFWYIRCWLVHLVVWVLKAEVSVLTEKETVVFRGSRGLSCHGRGLVGTLREVWPLLRRRNQPRPPTDSTTSNGRGRGERLQPHQSTILPSTDWDRKRWRARV